MNQSNNQNPDQREYSDADLQILNVIHNQLIYDLGDQIGKYSNVPLLETHMASWFRRYQVLKEILYTNLNPELKNLIVGSSSEIKIADFSVGNGMAIIDLLRDPNLHILLGNKELRLSLFDLQMNERRATQINNWMINYGINWFSTAFERRDLRIKADESFQFNLGIIGSSHFYLTSYEFIFAILSRLSECKVLFVAPISKQGDLSDKTRDGIFIYQTSDGVKTWSTSVDLK